MNIKKWVKSIQTAGYNGARTVIESDFKRFRLQKSFILFGQYKIKKTTVNCDISWYQYNMHLLLACIVISYFWFVCNKLTGKSFSVLYNEARKFMKSNLIFKLAVCLPEKRSFWKLRFCHKWRWFIKLCRTHYFGVHEVSWGSLYTYSYLSIRRVYKLSMQGDIFEKKS